MAGTLSTSQAPLGKEAGIPPSRFSQLTALAEFTRRRPRINCVPWGINPRLFPAGHSRTAPFSSPFGLSPIFWSNRSSPSHPASGLLPALTLIPTLILPVPLLWTPSSPWHWQGFIPCSNFLAFLCGWVLCTSLPNQISLLPCPLRQSSPVGFLAGFSARCVCYEQILPCSCGSGISSWFPWDKQPG